MKQRIKYMLISLDQFLFCVLSLGKYHPDMTLSAQCWKWEMENARKWPRQTVDWLFSGFEKNHCYQSWLSEVNSRHYL